MQDKKFEQKIKQNSSFKKNCGQCLSIVVRHSMWVRLNNEDIFIQRINLLNKKYSFFKRTHTEY